MPFPFPSRLLQYQRAVHNVSLFFAIFTKKQQHVQRALMTYGQQHLTPSRLHLRACS
jgi:hypothetical protein